MIRQAGGAVHETELTPNALRKNECAHRVTENVQAAVRRANPRAGSLWPLRGLHITDAVFRAETVRQGVITMR